RPVLDVERPADPGHGDFASNLAMRLARPYRMAPLVIAECLGSELNREATERPAATPIADATSAAPGFLNVRLSEVALEQTISGILHEPTAWGRVAPLGRRVVNVEFVSANPTGPLNIGNARGAFVGVLLCRVLEAG